MNWFPWRKQDPKTAAELASLRADVTFNRGWLHSLSNDFSSLKERVNAMVADFKALEDQVAANTDAEQSAIVLLGQLSQMLKDAIATGNMQKVSELQQKLEASRAALAAAVVTSTPEQPTP